MLELGQGYRAVEAFADSLSGLTIQAVQALAGHVLNWSSRMHWLFLLSAVVPAAVLYWFGARQASTDREGLVRFLFPREVWLHPSSLLDLRFLVVDTFVFALLIAPFALSTVATAEMVNGALISLLGKADAAQPGALAIGVFSVALFLIGDLFRFVWHISLHRFSWLWEFHKVHHSATVLVPMTVARLHPLERFGFLIAEGLATGLTAGVFLYFYHSEFAALTVLGVQGGRFVFNLTASNLRHSHIWWSWGPVIETILISPAQHQVHHSQAREHWDRNYGSQFALWDWMAGSLYRTGAREEIRYGTGEEDRAFNSVASLYLYPFVSLMRRLPWRRRSSADHRA